MFSRISRPLAVFILGTAILCAAASMPAQARDIVAEGDMQRYCQGQAAEKFHINPRDILTLPVEHDDGYTVYGQFPPEGSEVTTFECHFGSYGKWKRVVITGEAQQTSYSSSEDVVAEADMPRYCMGEASAAFDVRPQDILTLPLERDPGGFVVYGQYSADQYDVTTFQCHFSDLGVFQTVYAD